MRFLLIILVLFFLTSCSNKPNNCSKFKTGTFVYLDSKMKGLKIERNDSMQIETDKNFNSKIICEVKWLSECSFLVTPIESFNFPEGAKLVPIEVEITETTNNSYTFLSIIDSLGYKYEMKKVK